MELIPDLTRTIEADAIELAPRRDIAHVASTVYRNPSLPLMTRIRAATAALPHEHPGLPSRRSVNSGDFADQLEEAIERSRKVTPMIEAKPNVPTNNVPSSGTRRSLSINGKPTILDRRYRSW